MCIFSLCCLTAASQCPAFDSGKKTALTFKRGVHGPGASLPHCPREHFKSTDQSHSTGAKGQVPVLFALLWHLRVLPTQSLKRLREQIQGSRRSCWHFSMDKGHPDLQGFSFISTKHK